MQAIAAFFQIREDTAAIGALNYPKEARQKLALQSQKWNCEICGPIRNTIMPKKDKEESSKEKEKQPIFETVDSKKEIKEAKEIQILKEENKDNSVKAQNTASQQNAVNQAKKLPGKFAKKNEKLGYSNIKDSIIEDIEEYDDDSKHHSLKMKNHKDKSEESNQLLSKYSQEDKSNEECTLKKSYSLDSSNNLEFTEQLRRLRLNQFSNMQTTEPENIKSKQNAESYDDNYFANIARHNSTKDIKSSAEEKPGNTRPTLSSLNNSNIIKSTDDSHSRPSTTIPEITKNENSAYFAQKQQDRSLIKQQQVKEIQIEETEPQAQEEVSKKESKPTLFSKSLDEIEFNKTLFTLKQINSPDELRNENALEKELKEYIKESKDLKIYTKDGLEGMLKKRQQAYKILLLNKYNEAKYKRITICVIVIMIFLVLLGVLTFSQLAREVLFNLVNSIPIEIEIN